MEGDRPPAADRQAASPALSQPPQRSYSSLAASRAGASQPRRPGGSGGSRSGSGGGSGGKQEQGGSSSHAAASAFFNPMQRRQQQQYGPAAATTTPPVARSAARIATPGSPFEDEELLFAMTGLKPLRTSSRTSAAAAATPAWAGGGSRRSQPAASPYRTWSAPAAEAEADEAPRSPLSRAFSFADAPSPAVPAVPLSTTSRQRPRSSRARQAAADVLPAAALGVAGRQAAGGPAYTAAASPAACPPSARGRAGSDAEGDAASSPPADSQAPAGPAWSEELLSWMLHEKATLLVEAQRAARRQQELEAELGRLRARGGDAEREAQRLTAERRSLLERVQHLSAAEAEAAAQVERLLVENDALTSELERCQEVAREMLAARRAARDALSEMSAQNARLLAAYVDKKQEAARLKDALRQQKRDSEARIQELEAQLHVALTGRPGCVQDRPEEGIATPSGLGLRSPDSSSSASPAGGSAGSPDADGSGSVQGTPEPARSPGFFDKEAENVPLNAPGSGGRKGQGPQKALWDDERSELLSLLERLQGQLAAHAAHQQPGEAAQEGGEAPGGSGDASPACPAAQASPGSSPAAARSDASPSSSSSSPFGSSSRSSAQHSDGASPAVMEHHVADSPATERRASRASAPSPPSVRRPTAAAADQPLPAGQQNTPGGTSQPVPQQASQQHAEAAGEDSTPAPRPRPSPLSTSSSRTLEGFLSPAATPKAEGQGTAAAADEQQEEAQQRAAEQQAEAERLRQAQSAADHREHRRQAAETAKAAGNAAFRLERFEDALEHYTKGLSSLLEGEDGAEVDAKLAAVLHCNRAAAHQACSRYLHALADCYRAEALDPSYARTFHRRADAYWALGAWDAAAKDLARLVAMGAGQDAAARLAEAQRRSQAAQPPNHYSVLGVKPSALPGEIKAAYKQLARAFHPDKMAHATGHQRLTPEAAATLFKLASEAAALLGDGERRRHHDLCILRFKYARFYSGAAASPAF